MAHSPPDAAWEQVREALARVERDSPFYRAKLAAAGDPCRRGAHAGRLPPRAADPQARGAGRAAGRRRRSGRCWRCRAERIASIAISPGPLYIPRTADEPTGVEALHESLRHMGVRADDVAHVTLSYHIMPGGLRMQRAFEQFGCRVINGGVGNSELQVQIASTLGATVYVGTPSFLATLAEVAAQQGRRSALPRSASRPPRR